MGELSIDDGCPSLGWDSGVGSNFLPHDGQGGLLDEDFPSHGGSGMLASEPQSACSAACTCEVQQPDKVKVVIARDGKSAISAVDQKLRELRTLKQHYYPEVNTFVYNFCYHFFTGRLGLGDCYGWLYGQFSRQWHSGCISSIVWF